jgi:hypothetical protein
VLAEFDQTRSIFWKLSSSDKLTKRNLQLKKHTKPETMVIVDGRVRAQDGARLHRLSRDFA